MRISSLLEFLFPSICLSCERKGQKFFCSNCWLLCELPDPVNRCRHCFEELSRKEHLCGQCRKNRKLPIVRAYVFDPESPAHLLGFEYSNAMAGFALIQWVQLDWPMPDAIIPMPDANSIEVGKALANLLERPFVRALSSACEYKKDRLEEDQILLLFDACNPLAALKKTALFLSEAFPKKIYLLSLYPYVDRHC